LARGSLAYDPVERRVICGHAIVKELEGKTYSPDMKPSEQ
jgi:hypothetical protein